MTLETVYDALRIAQYATNERASVTQLCVAMEALTNHVADLDKRLAAMEREQREILNLDDVSGLLGCHTETVRRYYGRDVDPLPVHRPSERSLVFLRSEVIAWLTRQ